MDAIKEHKAVLFKFPATQHRKLKSILASRDETMRDWFRRKIREEIELYEAHPPAKDEGYEH